MGELACAKTDENWARCWWSRNARISSGNNGRANHCMLFFTKICMAVHAMEQARSIAMCGPPPMDMWAPRRISDFLFSIFGCPGDQNRGFRDALLLAATLFNFGLHPPMVPIRK